MYLDVYKQCCFNRAYEYEVATALNDKVVVPPVYLSVGTEYIPVILKKALQKNKIEVAHIFAQHRCHSYYLTFFDKAKELGFELCGDVRGCNRGQSGSASISNTDGKIKMWGHSGLLGDQVPIAAGYAHASKEVVICVMGDAAAEEDYVLGALGYAVTKKCPILFLCEDNNLSLLTTKAERRSWDIENITRAMGIQTDVCKLQTGSQGLLYEYSVLSDALYNVSRYCRPAFVSIEVCRHLWHAGSGTDGEPRLDYLKEFEHSLIQHGISTYETMEIVRNQEQQKAKEIWKQIRSEVSAK